MNKLSVICVTAACIGSALLYTVCTMVGAPEVPFSRSWRDVIVAGFGGFSVLFIKNRKSYRQLAGLLPTYSGCDEKQLVRTAG